MFRFIMTVLLMAACFYAGKMSAQEEPVQFIIENVEQDEVSPQELLALVQNPQLKAQFPKIYLKLIAILNTPKIQAELINPNRSQSRIYTRLVEMVIAI